jgi:fused signal recognition particle receptor
LSEAGWLERLTAGFRKTSDRLGDNLTGLFTKAQLDERVLDQIEEALIASDLGPRPPPRSGRAWPRSIMSSTSPRRGSGKS